MQAIVGQDSTDSLLDAPVLEALQRRHSDVKLGSSLTAGQAGGLAPPRSPELRRHSDVSPASLKELEKVQFYRQNFTAIAENCGFPIIQSFGYKRKSSQPRSIFYT